MIACSLWAEASALSAQEFPRIIHQQHKTRNQSAWPPEWRALSSMWKARHPDWQWRFWTDEEEEVLFRDHLPEFYDLYKWIPQCREMEMAQADMSTYAILYVHGGIYADLDSAPFTNLEPIIAAVADRTGRSTAILTNIERPLPEDGSAEERGNGGLEEPYSLDNDVMIATAPKHEFFYGVLQSIMEYVTANNHTVCKASAHTATFDPAYMTSWGRISMAARAWTAEGMDVVGLKFLESMFLRERVDATFSMLALHVLSNASLEDLRIRPPPRNERHLERWLNQSTKRQQKREKLLKSRVSQISYENEGLQAKFTVFAHSPDLLILPIAVGPGSLPKAVLRRRYLECTDHHTGNVDVACFEKAMVENIIQEFPHEAGNTVLAICNQDEGIWEGSWDDERQKSFAKDLKEHLIRDASHKAGRKADEL